MSVGPTRGPVQRPGEDRDMTEIFQRLADVEAQPPGRWIYAGTYPGDPDTTPDSPPFQNSVTGWLRFRRNGEWNLDVEAVVDIPGDAVYPLTVITVDELYRPTHNVQAAGVGVDWELQTDGDLVVTGLSGGGGSCSCAAVDVTFDGSSTIPADNVQDAIEEVKQELLDHIADTVAAHMASAIGVVASSIVTADDVQEALEELYLGAGGTGFPGIPELIYRYTVTGSDKASIDTGTDTPAAGSNDWTNGDVLEIWMLLQGDNAATVDVAVDLTLNNDTGSNYDNQAISAVNTTVSGAGTAAQASWAFNTKGQGGSTSYPSVHRITIPGYAATTFFKVAESSTSRIDTTAANQRIDARALGYRSTSAITRAKIAARTTQKLKVGSQLLIYKRRNT